MKNYRSGMSLVEIILASALFVIVAAPVVGILLQVFTADRLANEETIASQYAAEGLEAARDIRNRSTTLLTVNSGEGAAISGGVWTFTGTSTFAYGKFTRAITVTSTYRDTSGNVVASGTLDPNTMKVISTVTWGRGSATDAVALTEYLTTWRKTYGGGMLVYDDGGTTADTVKYQIFDGQNWGASTSLPAVTSTANGEALRAGLLYSSVTRNEKILISHRVSTGSSTQYIYAQVYNASTAAWGNTQLLSSWSGTTLPNVQNFDGTYLANGDFMAIYSDNTATPKFETWNGASWSSVVSMQAVSSSPAYIVARARPNSSEVMVAVQDQSTTISTEYFNGGTYIQGNWTKVQHATTSPTSTSPLIDFAWSPATTTNGALLYAPASTTKSLALRRWSANGTGSGAWSSAITSAVGSSTVRSVGIAARGGVEQYLGCEKDASSTIRCYLSNSTPAWSTPTNNFISATTDSGIERSFDVSFGSISSSLAVITYSDNTATPKFKVYTASTTSFAASASSITALAASTTGVYSTPRPDNDDIMFLMGNSSRQGYSIVWDGFASLMATSTGRGLLQHNTNGSAANELWFTFAWDTL